MTEVSFFVIDDAGDSSLIAQGRADEIPTFEYPGDAEIPAVRVPAGHTVVIVGAGGSGGIMDAIMRAEIGGRLLRRARDADPDELQAWTENTNRIRNSIFPAGEYSVYKCSPKGKGKRAERKMRGKLGLGW